MGRGRHRTYPKEDNNDSDKIKELKAANRRLKSDNERLKKELATLEEAFKETAKYVKDNTEGFTVKEVIEGAKTNKTIKQMKTEIACEKCDGTDFKTLSGGPTISIRFCLSCNNRTVLKGIDNE